MDSLAIVTSFNGPLKNDVQKFVQSTLQKELDKITYDHNDAQLKSNKICDSILKHLTTQNKNFKFIVNCLLMQKAECGLNISGSCFWDNDTDGSLTIKHETEAIIGIVNVFACAL
ncbi:unnamed protein product (macronuclear) [Paramecium tetraurelia]|uniref:Dynein light chain n=1 Tax=Paramecium tetraurelia TaxID=5888 RepID=A0BMS9_PARTE|nr:uncharacterized protein GSPATT00030482001 [Paramecium tetraurelia]CAK59846.1 unnamed protein product [Paramecium tetraurelia]|eukprot:XP_001427244.1 hypothetical protein (macronuclear) [Paramecium tetraurelia strain d4-2]